VQQLDHLRARGRRMQWKRQDIAGARPCEGVTCGSIFVEADPDGKEVEGERIDEPAQAIALAEVLVDDESVGKTQPRREAPALVPPTVTPCALRTRLAVGMTTIFAFLPPETFRNRSRMARSFSLFSAPPMGMIQPRVSPGGILPGM
jgi:hypothetical protein